MGEPDYGGEALDFWGIQMKCNVKKFQKQTGERVFRCMKSDEREKKGPSIKNQKQLG